MFRTTRIIFLRALILAAVATTLMVARVASAAEHGAGVAAGVAAGEALRMILEGNQRFVAAKMEHPHQTPARRDEIAKRQHPFAAVLACADSRTAPEILLDRGLGDIFVVRVAGNVADQVVIDSLDYSVTHLGVRLVMVLGHRRCGAVIAAVEGHEQAGDVGPMLSELRPAVEAAKKMPGDPIENAVRANVELVVANLANSKELGPMVKSGKLKIVGAIYDLDRGKIEMLK